MSSLRSIELSLVDQVFRGGAARYFHEDPHRAIRDGDAGRAWAS